MNTQKVDFIKSGREQKAFLRDGRHAVAFAGRSNVGKSSVINSLLNRKNYARVGATPGKTVQVNYFLVDGTYFIDLPGYGYARVSGRRAPPLGRAHGRFLSGAEPLYHGRPDRRFPPCANGGPM